MWIYIIIAIIVLIVIYALALYNSFVKLNNNEHTKMHSRHIGIDKAKEIGLKIKALESDDKLQDAILSVHHCYMHTFQNTNAVKILENQKGVSFIMIGEK